MDSPQVGATSIGTAWRSTPAVASVAGAGAALGGAAALYVLASDAVEPASISVATGSAGTVLGMLAAWLFVRRMRRTGAVVDVILGATVALLAMVNAALSLVGASDTVAGKTQTQLLVSVGAGVVVSAGFALAAFIPNRAVANPAASADRLLLWGFCAAAGSTVAIAGAAAASGLALDGSAGIVAANLAAAVLSAAAAAGFVRRAEGRDLVIGWLAVGTAVAAIAHLCDAIMPWSPSTNLSSGDVVGLAGLVGLLMAGLRDHEWAHGFRAEAAILAERSRLARELHDGLANELAYISMESRRLSATASTTHLVEAAERALEESRAAIAALRRPADEPLERTITDAALSLGARSGIDVTVAVRPGLEVPADVRAGLLRILREAMANAARHGHAETIHVSVNGPSPLVMAIADDGVGFDVTARHRPDSFGLQSMTDRASNLGGSLSIESSPATGTTVAVVIP